MLWNWQQLGFRFVPRRTVAEDGLRLFRAWGGSSRKLGLPTAQGVCFSTQRPRSRTDAERLFSIWEWGNMCLWLTEFRVSGALPIYIGQVDPGDADPSLRDPRPGIQVFIENPLHGRVIEMFTTRLHDDLDGRYIVPGSRLNH